MTSIRKGPAAQNADDDYWNQAGLKRFNFDDDDDPIDSIEKIHFDGSTATLVSKSETNSRANQSNYGQGELSYRADTSSVSFPHAVSARAVSARAHRPTSSRKQQYPPSPATLQKTGSGPKPNSALETRSIPEVLAAHEKQSAPSATSVAKLETDLNSLRRQLNQAKRDRAAAPSRDDTLRSLMVGDPYVLEPYKSKADKAALLDGAIRRHDGNGIVAVTLFMRDTLKREIFSKELMNRPIAVDHYCAYLRDAGEIDELHETLSALGRTEEAAMLKYKQCLTGTTSASTTIRASGLKDCIKYYFDADPQLANETNSILEQIALMQRQAVVDESDSKAQKSGEAGVFQSHPRKESIVYKPVVDTLYYCCYYHWGEAENLYSSPVSVRNHHRIGDKQFMFTTIAALCRMRRWREIETYLTVPKTLFRSARLQAVIGMDRVVDVLSKNHSPPDALAKYCAEIETSDRRLEMAAKLECYKVAIDTLVHQRDRQQLARYLDHIPIQNQHMRQYAEKHLRSQDNKWKN